MHIIDLVLKNTPSLLSVQRKTSKDAEDLYQQVIGALKTGNPALLELTCEKDADKRIAVLVSEISAVQLSEKSGVGVSGRTPGFFALTSDQ